MTDFFQAVANPDIQFLRLALIAGVLSGFAFGIVGSYVVARRISYIAGAISHSVLGGIGIAMYLQYKIGATWLDPMIGATFAALASAGIIGVVVLRGKQREDTVIGVIWAIGMAIGLLFFAKTPGYVDPMSYLFGNILLITKADIWAIIILDIVVALVGILFYHKFLAVCFDDEFTRLRGINVDYYFLLLLALTALSVVMLIRIVGIVMVIALMTIPPAVAGYFVRHLWQMMIGAVIFCVLFIVLGLGVSYSLDLPTGPVIIIIAGFFYVLVIAGRSIFLKFRKTEVPHTFH